MARLESAAQPPLLKLVLLGDAGAGKTCLRLRFAKGVFPPGEDTTTTATAAFSVAHVDVDGVGVSVQVWDDDLADPNLDISFDGEVVVFDVTNSATLAAAAAQPPALARRVGIPRILVGTKCDRGDRTVTPAMGEGVAQTHGLRYFEASASTGAGVREAFGAIIRLAAASELRRRRSVLDLAEKQDAFHNRQVFTMRHKTSGYPGRAAKAGGAASTCCSV